MDFQTGKAIPDRHPFLLQFAGPVEICFLIEASQQFNQYKHFFPVLCRVNERVYNHGMLRKPVKCDPDIRNPGINRSLAEKMNYIVIRLLRKAKEQVLPFYYQKKTSSRTSF